MNMALLAGQEEEVEQEEAELDVKLAEGHRRAHAC